MVSYRPLFSVLGPVMAGGTPVPSYTTELERRTLRNLPTKGASSGHHSDAPDHIPVQVQQVRKCESTAHPHHPKKIINAYIIFLTSFFFKLNLKNNISIPNPNE